VDIFSTYAVNEDKEQNGTWMEVGDAKLLVARAGNKAYIKMLGKDVERNQKALDRKDDAADALSDKIMVDVLATTILLGWENVSFKGKPIEYSKDNAKMLLGFKEFRREVMKLADDFASFKAEQEAEEVKN
jgi:hypothetical protein